VGSVSRVLVWGSEEVRCYKRKGVPSPCCVLPSGERNGTAICLLQRAVQYGEGMFVRQPCRQGV